ncbi:MAG: hypothetical protein KDD66_17645 [Bdellovibrionales bacterium]|nr:hypothetical protein [Bdellovibrionales bacterium]
MSFCQARVRSERGSTMLQVVITLNIAVLGILAISQCLTPRLETSFRNTSVALRVGCNHSRPAVSAVCGGGSMEGNNH